MRSRPHDRDRPWAGTGDRAGSRIEAQGDLRHPGRGVFRRGSAPRPHGTHRPRVSAAGIRAARPGAGRPAATRARHARARRARAAGRAACGGRCEPAAARNGSRGARPDRRDPAVLRNGGGSRRRARAQPGHAASSEQGHANALIEPSGRTGVVAPVGHGSVFLVRLFSQQANQGGHNEAKSNGVGRGGSGHARGGVPGLGATVAGLGQRRGGERRGVECQGDQGGQPQAAPRRAARVGENAGPEQ
ncbi:hypothetical protein PUN4_40021 [Paraburkholderia unamae]|nr:hypothetical protein PUN4_40021 [Paraburkholderia unamae]